MNNDLSKLSDNELRQKIDDTFKGSSMVSVHINDLLIKHKKLVKKRRVRPNDLIWTKNQIDELRIAETLLKEYEKILIDEQNSRLEKEEENVETSPESILKNLKQYFMHAFSYNEIEKGYEISIECAPDKKIRAVKEFKALTGKGLKECKQFMDYTFYYISRK